MSSTLKKRNVFLRLIGYLMHYKVRVILSIVFTFIGVLSMALGPYYIGLATNNIGEVFLSGVTEKLASEFLFNLIFGGSSYLIASIMIILAQNILTSATQSTMYELRRQIDVKLHALPLNYYDTTTYGDILSRVTNDVNVIGTSLSMNIFVIVNTLFTVVIVLIMMLKISGVLTFVGLLSIPVLLWVSNKVTSQSQKAFTNQMRLTGDLNGYVEEYYNGHNIVTTFGKEAFVKDKFSKINEELFMESFKGDFLAGSLSPITMTINNCSLGLVAVVGAIIAICGGMSVGMIQAFAQYLTQFSEPVSEAMQTIPTIQSTAAAAERVFDFIDETEEIKDVKNPKFPEVLKGEVEFDHVRFGYRPHQTLIHDLNIKIKSGEKTAIVGPTGAGKTTLVNLIMRFYDVKGGAIRIDGVDIRDMRRSDLRKIFGMVLQDTWLYSASIMENIRYGRLDATDEEVIEAAKAARADAFIRTLPGGYNFVLHEGASNIAQGQRQLLTIARAMLANPPILILDEATSSVDTRTEVLIQEAMTNIMKGKTSFVIAHRLSTIKDSNNILYMQDGDILEVGNHEELMAKNGLYAKLYNSQFEKGSEE